MGKRRLNFQPSDSLRYPRPTRHLFGSFPWRARVARKNIRQKKIFSARRRSPRGDGAKFRVFFFRTCKIPGSLLKFFAWYFFSPPWKKIFGRKKMRNRSENTGKYSRQVVRRTFFRVGSVKKKPVTKRCRAGRYMGLEKSWKLPSNSLVRDLIWGKKFCFEEKNFFLGEFFKIEKTSFSHVKPKNRVPRKKKKKIEGPSEKIRNGVPKGNRNEFGEKFFFSRGNFSENGNAGFGPRKVFESELNMDYFFFFPDFPETCRKRRRSSFFALPPKIPGGTGIRSPLPDHSGIGRRIKKIRKKFAEPSHVPRAGARGPRKKNVRRRKVANTFYPDSSFGIRGHRKTTFVNLPKRKWREKSPTCFRSHGPCICPTYRFKCT